DVCSSDLERHHRVVAEEAHVLDVLVEVGKPRAHRLRIGALVGVGAAVVAEGPDGGHEHHRRGCDAGRAADEVEILLGAEVRSEEHTSELQSREKLVCRLLLEKKKNNKNHT